jgi:two-component system phosphate regulon sensor histidine kinase PhoR
MHSKNIRWLIVLLTIATCGILLIQTYWVMHAYTVSRQQLERDVKDALNEVVAQLEKKEEILFISDKMTMPITVKPPAYANNNASPAPAIIALPAKPSRHRFKRVIPASSNMSVTINGPVTIADKHNPIVDTDLSNNLGNTSMISHVLDTQNNLITIIDIDSSSADNDALTKKVNTSFIRIEHSNANGYKNSSLTTTMPGSMRDVFIFRDSATSLNRKAGELKQVIDQLVFELEDKKQDITQRVQKDSLTELLTEAFSKRNIDNNYTTGILNDSAYSVLPEKERTYAAQLFPNDIFSQKSYLLLNLHQPGWQVMKGMWVSIVISLFFSLLIISVFYLSVKTILKQKKLSNMKNDFINNMTHELKTPIATISIAADALNIDSNKERISHYTHVIKEENERMNRHIEQVLQMAMLEKKELELNTVAIDMHDLIHKVTRSFNLPLEAKQGSISFKLEATQSVVEADPYHITNVLNNLIDNAIKYSVNTPEIDLFTSNHDGYITITVSDKGKGMSKEAQKYIFDKFYRVSSGNIHDVKGFGLGLSYVKTIVEAHKGNITVSSTENEGSSFTIQLKTIPT